MTEDTFMRRVLEAVLRGEIGCQQKVSRIVPNDEIAFWPVIDGRICMEAGCYALPSDAVIAAFCWKETASDLASLDEADPHVQTA